MPANGADHHSTSSLSIPGQSFGDSTTLNGSATIAPSIASSSWAAETATIGDNERNLEVSCLGCLARVREVLTGPFQLQTLTDQLNHEFMIKEGAEDMLRQPIPVSSYAVPCVLNAVVHVTMSTEGYVYPAAVVDVPLTSLSGTGRAQERCSGRTRHRHAEDRLPEARH